MNTIPIISQLHTKKLGLTGYPTYLMVHALPGDAEPIVTKTLAVRTINMKSASSDKASSTASNATGDSETEAEEDDGIPLPVPEGMEESEAPKVQYWTN